MARNDPDDDAPVRKGLIALVGVGLVIGVLVSLAALAASQVLGLSDAGSGSGGGTAADGQSMILPSPSPTESDSAPAFTLAPQPGPGELAGDGGVDDDLNAPTAPASVATGISLTASLSEVGRGQRIPLEGSYPTGDGATLQVERLTGDSWSDFPVDTSVTGGVFATYIRTSLGGQTSFRMRDTATGETSNEITVNIL